MVLNRNPSFLIFNRDQNERFQSYNGWNNSQVIKFNLKKMMKLILLFLKNILESILDKEKILVVTSGHIEINSKNKKLSLIKFDALNFSLMIKILSFKYL